MDATRLTVHETEAERLERLAAGETELQAGERDAAAALLQSADERAQSIKRLLAAAHILRHGESTLAAPIPEPGAGPRVDPPGSEPGGAPASSLVTTGDDGDLAPVCDREGAASTQDRILSGAALGRARAAEPTTCPDCGRTIARGQLPGHRGTHSCSLEQERRTRAAEREAVLAAPVSEAPPARPTTVILGGSTSRIAACDLCGREMPQAGLRTHRGRGRCRAAQDEQRAAAEAAQTTEPVVPTAQRVEPMVPTAKAEPMVAIPLMSRPQRRPLRAEDVPSSIMGRQMQPGDLRGVSASVTRAIGAAPERTSDSRAPRAAEALG